MTAQDFVQPNCSVQDIRKALTVSKIERGEICGTNKAIKRAVLALGGGGGICGQCEAFKPLGDVPGLNGTCFTIVKRCYTRPEDPACQFFNQKEGE